MNTVEQHTALTTSPRHQRPTSSRRAANVPGPLEVVDAATRREFLAMVAAAGLLVACGDDTAGTGSTPDSDRIRLTNDFGTFEVPRQPARVVGWEGRRDLETALAVGLNPIGVGSNALFGDDQLAPFVPFDLDGVTVIEQTEPNLELIASLRPDLILTRRSNIENLLDELRPLAPLVPVEADGPWRSDLERVADALERTDELAATLAAYDERRNEIRARHSERIDSAVLAVVQYFDEEQTFYTSPTTGFYLQANTLAELGGTHLPFIEDGGDALADTGFSLEQVEQLGAADAIVLITNTDEDRSGLDASPLWQRLPAVQAGRVVHTDFRTNYGSVYAATACLELLDATYATFT